MIVSDGEKFIKIDTTRNIIFCNNFFCSKWLQVIGKTIFANDLLQKKLLQKIIFLVVSLDEYSGQYFTTEVLNVVEDLDQFYIRGIYPLKISRIF
jgi:hypothetical protein